MSKPEGTKLICLTPVKNEAWILERFLQCTSLWADHIIVADQHSTDNSREIAQSFEKVILIENTAEDFTEIGMRTLLQEEARKIPAQKRILISLDADEVLTANSLTSPEWRTLFQLPVGSVIRMPLVNLEPDMAHYKKGIMVNCGVVDDGKTALKGGVLHSVRIPWATYDITILETRDMQLLHFAYINPERLRSKWRRYQAYEKIARNRSGIATWNMYEEAPSPALPLPAKWLEGYQQKNIDMTSVSMAYDYWHDYQVLGYLDTYGAAYFRKCDIWDMNWVGFAQGKVANPERFKDPTTKLDRLAKRFTKWAVKHQHSVIQVLIGRIGLRFFRALGY